MDQFDNPAVLTEEGYFVSDKWLRLSEILHDYNPDLELRWIPPANRSDGDRSRPYAIVHSPHGRPAYVVMFAGELDEPQAILARIFAGDTSRNNVLGNLDAKEAARQAFELHERADRMAELEDQARWFAGTHKNWVTMPNGEKIDRTLPNGGRG